MPDDRHEIYLVIHGHFYQPPRENPWLEAIEREGSAHPFPNWNARIADECYATNAWARVFDPEGRVTDLVNNYLHLSFNFGPTLLSWLETQLPDTYRRILEADRLSAARRSGHGNAIAQAYGHAILPLCNDRDRRTQIRWGKRDFFHRFGREPEAMWLPETAVDLATVEDLIDEGLRYVILSPRRARRVRPIGESAWTDVSGSKIDPRRPYRLFSQRGRGALLQPTATVEAEAARDPTRYLDVFFYDGPVSHSISFEKVLYSSHNLADKLWGAVDTSRAGPQLDHTAVDGETFGHHMRHAERALSYAFVAELPARGFRLTNYGEVLERLPPTFEVELDLGPRGEGSSWSCVHGVGRWCRDCGCNSGAPAGWNQAWREPLRRTVNLVRDEAAELFVELGDELFVDAWAARDDYVQLVLDPSTRSREQFFARHAREGGRATRQVRALKLLELQRHSLLAQTSCGWFFNDISGLEAVQVLRYAARTVQLMEELSGRKVERQLLEVLGEARSNVAELGTGADVYRQLVLPAAIDRRRIVAQYAITDMFRNYPDDAAIAGYHLQRNEARRLTSGPVTVAYGRLQVEFVRTGETSEMTYGLIHFGGHDFHCAVSPSAGVQEFRRFTERLDAIFERATITELLRAVDAHFGEAYYGLQHLLPEEREDVLDALFGHIAERFSEMYVRLYQENRRTVSALIDTGLKIPREFRMAAEYTLSRQLNREVRSHRESRDPDSYRKAQEIVAEATLRGYALDRGESEEIFGAMLGEAVRRLVAMPTQDACCEALATVGLAELLKIPLALDDAQNLLYEMLHQPGRRDAWRPFEEMLGQLVAQLKLAPSCLR
jgi:alpha-amylase/alpha-mannosidase (GH57 family)